MSYRRSYSETITVSGSKTESFSYPASEHGGSRSVTIYYTEHVPVNVNINVDTDPFDQSINGCNNSVNVLTGAVVATETAQIASIDKNSRKIAGTIIEGFFKHVRFEISGQIAELSQRIDALLMDLHERAKQLTEQKQRMEINYNHTANRYTKIFEDLNNELTNRVSVLDKPAFKFKQQADHQSIRSNGNDLVNTVTIFGAEGGSLQAKISASITKKRALDAIGQANIFLRKQKVLENTINRSMLKENISAVHYLPVCLLETKEEKGKTDRSIYQPDAIPRTQTDRMAGSFETKQWGSMPEAEKENIRRYFNSELSNTYFSADPHIIRVKDTITKMLDLNTIKSL